MDFISQLFKLLFYMISLVVVLAMPIVIAFVGYRVYKKSQIETDKVEAMRVIEGQSSVIDESATPSSGSGPVPSPVEPYETAYIQPNVETENDWEPPPLPTWRD